MGLFNPPPAYGGTISTETLCPAPTDYEQEARQKVEGAKKQGFWEHAWTVLWASAWDGVKVIISAIFGQVDNVFSLFVELMTAAQGLNQPGFFKLLSELLSDLLGVEVNSDTVQASFQQRGRIGALTTIGQQLTDLLTSEFTSGQAPNSLAPSSAGAAAFLGFLMEFAVREGNIETLIEIVPEQYNIFEGIRSYGVNLARNLGLGRMARRALQPLVQILIADPLTWQLNKQYRPKLLGADQLIRGWFREQVSDADLQSQLAWQGYRDDFVATLKADYGKQWTVSEVLDLFRLGTITESDAVTRMRLLGIAESDAQDTWDAAKFSAVLPLQREVLTHALTLYREGYVPIGEFDDQLANVKLSPDEVTWWRHIRGQYVEYPRRLLSEAQLEKAYLDGIITLSDIQLQWNQRGYSVEGQNILTLLLLARQAAGTRTSSGHVTHKHLSEAQLEKAYRGGILNLAQIQAGWTALGYSPADQEVLTALVTAKTPAPGTTTLPGLTTP